jgi:hypothetical protein
LTPKIFLPTEIWQALKAACEADAETAKLIIETAEIIVAAPDMSGEASPKAANSSFFA